MLESLLIRNFVLIEDAEMRFGSGLTVLTGETGAGKTLLTRALGLLVGERAEDGLVGPVGDEAVVQAVFEVEPVALADMPPDTAGAAALEPGEVIVTRRLSRQGRNRCFVNDSAVTLGTLGEVVGRLLSFSGQHEYRRLLDPGYQLSVLDEWAGEDVVELAREVREAVSRAEDADRRLEEAHLTREARSREMELLRFQVKELDEAGISEAEERELLAEQRRLAHAEELLRHAGIAADLVSSDGDQADASSLVSQAASHLGGLRGVDDSLDVIATSLEEVHFQLADLSRDLKGFVERVEVDPSRLQVVDDRLRVYTDLGRKYGGDTGAAVAFHAEAARRLGELERVEEDLLGLVDIREKHVALALESAGHLRERRREAAPRLEAAVAAQLEELGMPDARLEVSVSSRDGWEGLRRTGLDSVEFLLAANPGLPAKSLARTASGGELSRVLLALKCALAGVGGGETLVLDEIDAGIGGRTATAVGRKIRELASTSQVVVVTHLAQVAALADRNYVVDKATSEGPAATRLTLVEGEALVEELCRMMGGDAADIEAMAHARELRDRATKSLID